jgi:DNA polymerase V
VFAHTSPFREDVPSYFIQQSVQLSVPTQDTAEIIKTAVGMLREYFPAQESTSAPALFKKAGVIIWNITSARVVQQDLFDTIDRTKQKALLEAIDEINRRNGHDTVRIATQGTNVRFGLQNAYLAHQYTTNIDDVIVAKIK